MKAVLRIFIIILTIIIAVSVLIVFYLNSEKSTIKDVQKNVDDINRLVELNAQWDLDVLKIYSNLISQYDRSYKANEQHIIAQINLIDENALMPEQKQQLLLIFQKKIKLAEQLIDEQITLKNALIHLLSEYETLSKRDLVSSDFRRLNGMMNNIVNSILRFNYMGKSVDGQQAHSFLLLLEKELNNLPKREDTPIIQNQIKQIIQYANAIIVKRPLIDDILSELLQLNFEARLQQIRADLNEEINSGLQDGRNHQKYLILYAALLLLMIIFFAVRLIQSNHQLSVVNKKLSHLNRQLKESVSERTSALEEALNELKASEAYLVQSEKMASLGQLVAGVVHEINTPLAYAHSAIETLHSHLSDSNLGGFVQHSEQLIKSLLISEKTAQDYQSMKENVEILHGLILNLPDEYFILVNEMSELIRDAMHGITQIQELTSNLRNFSRLDKSKIAKYSLKSAINSALLLLKHELSGKKIQTNFISDAEVTCMPSQINQVLLNIINNAHQATKQNGSIKITLRKFDARFFAVDIQDDGEGIHAEDLSKIFDPFFTTKPVGKGTGLGLSICYKIIQDHGGDILVSSTPHKGTKFTIKLPVVSNLDEDCAIAHH